MDTATAAGLVILFHNVKTQVRVHAADCAMVNTARGTGARKMSLVEYDDDQRADLEERGYTLTFCKCCKDPRA